MRQRHVVFSNVLLIIKCIFIFGITQYSDKRKTEAAAKFEYKFTRNKDHVKQNILKHK